MCPGRYFPQRFTKITLFCQCRQGTRSRNPPAVDIAQTSHMKTTTTGSSNNNLPSSADVPLFEPETEDGAEVAAPLTPTVPHSSSRRSPKATHVGPSDGTHMVPITNIVVREDLQSRNAMSLEIVEEYAQDLRAGSNFPPIHVVQVDEQLLLVDGFHRVCAYQKAGLDQIPVRITVGSYTTAVELAVSANQIHGLRRTNADKQRAIKLLFGQAELVAWSDRRIAQRLNVAHKTVASIRRHLEADGQIVSVKSRVSTAGRTQRSAVRSLATLPPPELTAEIRSQTSGDVASPSDSEVPNSERLKSGLLTPLSESNAEFRSQKSVESHAPDSVLNVSSAPVSGLMAWLRVNCRSTNFVITVTWVLESLCVQICFVNGLASETFELFEPDPDAQLIQIIQESLLAKTDRA
jgi:ParB-like chromosome segregation protein Spo0J